MKNRLLIFISVLIGLAGKAQTEKRPVIIEPKIHTGMNLPFYKALYYCIQDDIYAFDLSVSFPTYGKSYWEKLYNYPRTGIGYSYWSLGNDEVYGKAYVLYSYISIPFFKRTEKLSFNYQLRKFPGSGKGMFNRLYIPQGQRFTITCWGKDILSHRFPIILSAT